MSYEPGTRVFAVLSANSDEIKLLGFGTYVGDYPRGPEIFPEGDYKMAREVLQENDKNPLVTPEVIRQYHLDKGATEETSEEEVEKFKEQQEKERARPIRERAHELLSRMNLNPKIELDDGRVVWGYQCWWGPEDKFDEFVEGREVINTTIEEALSD